MKKKLLALATSIIISNSAHASEYQYKIFEFNKLSDTNLVEERLNEYGSEGWKIEGIERIIMGSTTAIQIYMSKEKIPNNDIDVKKAQASKEDIE